VAGGLSLNAVVSHRRRTVQPFLDVAGFQNLLLLRGVTPNARVAVGLQLESNGQCVGGVRIRFLCPPNLFVGSEQMLNMVSELVRDHVGLGEVAGRPEPTAQLVVEREVDVDLLVERTVEWSHRGLADAAAGLGRVAEKHELGVVPRRSHRRGQQLRPRYLRRVEHERDELYFLRLFGSLLNGRSLARRLLNRLVAAAGDEISAEHEAQDQQDHGAADADRHAKARSTTIFDVAAWAARAPSHRIVRLGPPRERQKAGRAAMPQSPTFRAA